jgi:hypothetical protein
MINRSGRAAAPRALRMLLDYEGDRITVRERLTVEAATPASDPIRGFEGQSGFWYELRDAKGALLYRRITGHPIRSEVEEHDPDTGFHRHAVEKPTGVFTVLLPDLPKAATLVIVGSPVKPEQHAKPATPLATFPFRQSEQGRAR